MSKKNKDVFDTIAELPGEALTLKIRSHLMDEIRGQINSKQWTRAETAKCLGITSRRVSYLYRGNPFEFSLEDLLNMLASLGNDVKVKVKVKKTR